MALVSLQKSESDNMSRLRRMKQQAREMGIDPSTVQGRKAVSEGERAIIAQQKRAELEAKAGPHATEFVNRMLVVLEEKGGITDEEIRKKCGYEMNEILRKSFKSLLGPCPDATLLLMAGVLEKYGVKDSVVQEDIIMDYLVTLKEIGGVRISGK